MSDKKFGSLQELFGDEGRWCKEPIAVNVNGEDCAARDEDACSWCLLGGMLLLYEPHGKFTDVRDRLRVAIGDGYGKYIADFNDHPSTTIDDIRRVVKEANV